MIYKYSFLQKTITCSDFWKEIKVKNESQYLGNKKNYLLSSLIVNSKESKNR